MVTDHEIAASRSAIAREGGASGANVARPAVVVTGGSRGIGLAFAQRFADQGRNVAILGRDRSALERALTTFGQYSRAKVFAIACDVTDDQCFAVITRELQSHGFCLDVLVNCAGIGLGGPFIGQTVEDLDRLVAVNVGALTRLTRMALPDMIARRAGGIINVSSLGALVPGPNQAAYYASKSYVLALTEALASETSGSGVRVVAVLPGPADTEFHATMGAEDALYRFLLPSMSATAVARSAVWGFEAGHRLVVPGLFNKLAVLVLRLTPHVLTVPLMGLLLRRPRT